MVRRFIRRLFHVAAGGSLLLLLATAALWVRSFWATESFVVNLPNYFDPTTTGSVAMRFGRGGGLFNYWRYAELAEGETKPHPVPAQYDHFFLHATADPYRVAAMYNPAAPRITDLRCGPLGLQTYTNNDRTGFGYGVTYDIALDAPCWLLTLLWTAFPTIWLVDWLVRVRKKGKQEGYCSKCGYDLRASTGTCPECGTPISATPTSVTPPSA